MTPMNSNQIACPKCGTRIDVKELLRQQVEQEYQQKYEAATAELEQQKHELASRARVMQADLERALQEKLAAEKKLLEEAIRKSVREESAEQVQKLQKELDEKSQMVKELNRTKAEMARLEREKDELKDKLQLEAEQKLNDAIKAEKEKIRKQVEEREELKLREKDLVIEELKDQLKDAHRKAEQGSVQRQGEAQEIAIEEWLKAQFPLDTISEVKKWANGADCLQIVNTRDRVNCGSIYYESKRTKDFQPRWIEKFKDDMLAKGAHLGVLVTEAMPKDLERLGQKDGIWICTYPEFKSLCLVLRESLILLSTAVAAQENKGDKMAMLYDYLTGNEFKAQIEAIVEGFKHMQNDLAAERKAYEAVWKKREKQIEKVLLNTTRMFGSFRGILGNAVPEVPSLDVGHLARRLPAAPLLADPPES